MGTWGALQHFGVQAKKQEFEANLSYMASSRPAYISGDLVSIATTKAHEAEEIDG